MLIMIGIRLCQNHMTGSMSHPISAGVTDRQPRDRPGTHTTLYICWLIVELASPKGTQKIGQHRVDYVFIHVLSPLCKAVSNEQPIFITTS